MAGFVWIVTRAKPSRELWAAQNVRRQDMEPFAPQILGANSHRREMLFQSYLFVRIKRDKRFQEAVGLLRSTYGISQVLMQAGTELPAIIETKFITDLQKRVDRRGLVILPGDEIKEGDTVKVRSGTFTDCEGLYQGMDKDGRLRVLFSLLGHTFEREFSRSQVTKVA